MSPTDAEKLLGLVPGEAVSVRSVRAAWARKMQSIHPDTTAQPDTIDAPRLIKHFTEARNLLLENLAGQNSTCVMCRGVGTILGRLGRKQCVACNGTGDKFQ